MSLRLRDLPIRGKMLLLLCAASMLPVAAAVLTTFLQARALLEQQTLDLLSARADAVASALDAFHEHHLVQARALAASPDIAAWLRTPEPERADRAEAIRRSVASAAGLDERVRAAAIVGLDGRVLVASDATLEGLDLSKRGVSDALEGGALVWGPFVDRAAGPRALVTYVAPIRSEGEPVGAAVLLVPCSAFWERVRDENGHAGEGSFAVVVDAMGVRIAHGTRPEMIFHPTGGLLPSEREELIADQRFGERTEELLAENYDVPAIFTHARAPGPLPPDAIHLQWLSANEDWDLGVPRRMETVDWTVFVFVPERIALQPVDTLVIRSVLVGAVLAVASLAVGLLATVVLYRPVGGLMRAADAIRKGDHSARVRVETRDELGQLGDRFNEMAAVIQETHLNLELIVRRRTADLERANAELHAQREELVAQHAELEAQQKELEEKNREIQLADRMKSEFLANMSHELRTPLNSIIGFSDLVVQEAGEELTPQHRGWIEEVLGAGRHLLALINDLLDLTRIEAGRMKLHIQAVPVNQAVEEASFLMTPLAREKRITIKTAVSQAGPVAADPLKLRQILLNLLSNAVKFAPSGSTVEVGASAAGAAVTFWVRDEGPGISAALRPRLFEPFVQGEHPMTKQHQGTGLGLAITKRLVEHHGGTIHVESSPGRGCVFRFTIPPFVPGQTKTHRSIPPELTSQARVATPAPVQRRATPVVLGRVLVVDEDARVGELLDHLLGEAGYLVTVAYDAKSGLDAARRQPPDVFVVDVRLRTSSGTGLIEEIRSDAALARVPILVLTAGEVGDGERSWLRERVQGIAFKGDLTSDALVASVERAMRPETSPPPAGEHVLVVDDHDLNRQLARALLEGMDIEVREASDGPSAIAAIRAARPALVLLDLAMPHMDGFEVARTLKADPATRSVPLVALTALAMRGDEARAYDAGVDGYLTKPIDRAALQAELTKWMGPAVAG